MEERSYKEIGVEHGVLVGRIEYSGSRRTEQLQKHCKLVLSITEGEILVCS